MAVVHSAVLVEGESDRGAVLALARCRGQSLTGVEVVAMGGITNLGRYGTELGRAGRGLRLTGLYDAGEERFVLRTLERVGLGAEGFHRCEVDLEDELIRALGVDRALAVVEAQGEGESFRLLQRQPAQRDRTPEQHLHRFLGAGSGRKVRYGRLLVDALGPEEAPAPLRDLLDGVLRDPWR